VRSQLTVVIVFPEMRAQLRTYHSIPALQAHQDPSAYKQLQDAPRLKSILKGATEDQPQPSTIEEVRAAPKPRTNPVNLIFVMSQYAPKISETHFQPPRDFFDLVMRGSLSSASRARAFLWLIWWYLESDFSAADTQRNPFGPGQYGDGEDGADAIPLIVPPLESLTEEQAAVENVDTEEEMHFGEVKRKERIAILASEPSPAMTALKRARKEKALEERLMKGAPMSEDDGTEPPWYQQAAGEYTKRESATGSACFPPCQDLLTGIFAAEIRARPGQEGTGSEYTRSPSPAASRGFQAVNTPNQPAGDMRINNLLNDEAVVDTTPPASVSGKRGPGRGNWRRSRAKQETIPLAPRGTEGSHHVPLLPNTGQLSFVNETPHAPPLPQPATPGSSAYGSFNLNMSHLSPRQTTTLSFQPPNTREHVPTPSYQAQKRNRGITQHQSAVINHRKQQISYTLDRRIRKLHGRARSRRVEEGPVLRAWKRLRFMPIDYDSEEESIRVRKGKDRLEKEDDSRAHRNKENAELTEDLDVSRRPRVLPAGLVRVNGESTDIGEEAKTLARTFRRASRRLERWEESTFPGHAMIRRRQQRLQGAMRRRTSSFPRPADHSEMMDDELPAGRRGPWQQRSGTGRTSERRRVSEVKDYERGPGVEQDDDDGGGELDEEDRELLGEVDADESDEEDEDEEMGDV